MNEVLLDIMVTQCPAVNQEESDELKSYTSDQLALAPHKGTVNPEFLEVYDQLMQCLELVQKSPNQIEEERIEQMKKKVAATNTAPFYRRFVKLNGQPIVKPTQEDSSTAAQREVENSKFVITASPPTISKFNGNFLGENAVKRESTKAPFTTATTTSDDNTTISPVKSEMGVIDTVEHLFKQLYQNTINAISWFGRKKRSVHNEGRVTKNSNDPSVGKYPTGTIKISGFVSNVRLDSSSQHNVKFVKHLSPASTAKMHFADIFRGALRIATASCPETFKSKKEFISQAVGDIIFYIHKGLDDDSNNHEKVSVNRNIESRMKECSRSRP
jgi:hypothetical protein